MKTETGTGDFHAHRAGDGVLFGEVDWHCAMSGDTADLPRGISAARAHEHVAVVVQEEHPEEKWTAYLLEGAEFDEPMPHGAHVSVWYHAALSEEI